MIRVVKYAAARTQYTQRTEEWKASDRIPFHGQLLPYPRYPVWGPVSMEKSCPRQEGHPTRRANFLFLM